MTDDPKTPTTESKTTQSGFHVMKNGNASASYYKVLLFFVGIQTTIMVAGIPWAFSMHGRITAVESHLQIMAPLAMATHDEYDDLIQRITRCEVEILNIKTTTP